MLFTPPACYFHDTNEWSYGKHQYKVLALRDIPHGWLYIVLHNLSE